MAPKYLIDTDISSYVIKYQPKQVKEKFDSLLSHEMAISAVTKAELLYGLKNKPTNSPLHEKVKKYLMLMPTLDWTANASQHYADIHHHLQTTGQPIGQMDMMIAAHAIAINAILVTNNTKHFQRIVDINTQLTIENWV